MKIENLFSRVQCQDSEKKFNKPNNPEAEYEGRGNRMLQFLSTVSGNYNANSDAFFLTSNASVRV